MKYIAERRLLYTIKNSSKTMEMVARISEPFTVTQNSVSFPIDGVVSGCRLEFDGLNEPGVDYYGMDSLQAINIASDIDPILKILSERYDFYWSTGEPYFEE